MYRRILVPLDGSQNAECVIGHVEDILRWCEPMPVMFLHVMEPHPRVGEMLPKDVGLFEDALAAQAEGYLEGVKARFRAVRSEVVTEIVRGRAAETICDYAKEHGVDLIVMATHGRTGVAKMLLGSVTSEVVSCSGIPVLVVPPAGCRPGV